MNREKKYYSFKCGLLILCLFSLCVLSESQAMTYCQHPYNHPLQMAVFSILSLILRQTSRAKMRMEMTHEWTEILLQMDSSYYCSSISLTHVGVRVYEAREPTVHYHNKIVSGLSIQTQTGRLPLMIKTVTRLSTIS